LAEWPRSRGRVASKPKKDMVGAARGGGGWLCVWEYQISKIKYAGGCGDVERSRRVGGGMGLRACGGPQAV
jgi:hypothetical protein